MIMSRLVLFFCLNAVKWMQLLCCTVSGRECRQFFTVWCLIYAAENSRSTSSQLSFSFCICNALWACRWISIAISGAQRWCTIESGFSLLMQVCRIITEHDWDWVWAERQKKLQITFILQIYIFFCDKDNKTFTINNLHSWVFELSQ